MIRDALEVTDGLQKLGHSGTILVGHLTLAEFGEVCAQNVLVVVGVILDLSDTLSHFGSILIEGGDAELEALHGLGSHFAGQMAALGHGHGRSGQQTLVQLHHLFGGLALGNQLVRQLLKQGGRGQE